MALVHVIFFVLIWYQMIMELLVLNLKKKFFIRFWCGKLYNIKYFFKSWHLLSEIFVALDIDCCKNLAMRVKLFRPKTAPQCTFIRPSIKNNGFESILNSLHVLTPNMPLIQLWCAQSKSNMDEICSLNNHLWYVDIPQIFFWNSSMRKIGHFHYWICNSVLFYVVNPFIRKQLAHGGISK